MISEKELYHNIRDYYAGKINYIIMACDECPLKQEFCCGDTCIQCGLTVAKPALMLSWFKRYKCRMIKEILK